LKHPYAKNLNAEEVTKIRNAINRILVKEQLEYIPVAIKPEVWSTRFQFKRTIINGVIIIHGENLQFGEKFLTGSLIPKRIYLYKDTGKGLKLFSISKPMNAMLATIVASTILEEIAHASSRRLHPKSDAHGEEFYRAYMRLWRAHFDILHFQMIGIYGLDGDY